MEGTSVLLVIAFLDPSQCGLGINNGVLYAKSVIAHKAFCSIRSQVVIRISFFEVSEVLFPGRRAHGLTWMGNAQRN